LEDELLRQADVMNIHLILSALVSPEYFAAD
jgi:hypothetical protein